MTNSPIPTLMAVRMEGGTARKTAVRMPVSTSRVISRPSQTTSPMACAQVICGAMA